MRTKAFEGHKGEGAREWSSLSYNICVGCQHDCLYCYAKLRGSQRDPKLNQAGVWKNQRLNANRPKLGAELRKPGVVMFPTTHDIVPDFLPQAVTTLKNLLKRHQVLVVSKPHLAVVQTLCRELADYKQALLFRFTIGSLDSSICSFWEPGAPDPTERFAALKHAFNDGFATSVSMGPMIDSVDNTIDCFHQFAPFVTETIWIGKMGKVPKKLNARIAGSQSALQKLHEQQSDTEILRLVGQLGSHPKVRWKDRIKSVIANHQNAN